MQQTRTITLEVERDDVPCVLEVTMVGEYLPACPFYSVPAESWAEVVAVHTGADPSILDSFQFTSSELEELEDAFWRECRCACA